MIDSDLDVLLLLLYSNNQEEIIGITRLEKLIFLLVQNDYFKKFQKEFNFIEYDYGPWSSQILDNIEALRSYGLINCKERLLPILEKDYYQDEIELNFDLVKEFHENKTFVYTLSSDGVIVAQKLFSTLGIKESEVLNKIKSKFNKFSLNDLVRYVYHYYPNFTRKSVIKDKTKPLSVEEELKLNYPKILVNRKLLALVGSTPKIIIEEEKSYFRKLIREKYL